MEQYEVSCKAGQGTLTDFSLLLELGAASPSAQLDPEQSESGSNSNDGQVTSAPIHNLATTPESPLIVKATQLRLHSFNSTKICTSAASTSTSASRSPSIPVTLEYARMVLGHPFKVSRCHTLQALKLSARIKCTQYNASGITDDVFVHPSSLAFTIDELATSLAVYREAQRQQLLDLFGFAQQPDDLTADEAMEFRHRGEGLKLGVGHNLSSNMWNRCSLWII